MNEFFITLQRASLFGVAALAVALLLQWILANRVPAHWRVWVWRVALIQTALALIPLAPIALAILPAKTPVIAPKIIEAPIAETPTIADAPAVAASPDTMTPSAELSPPAIIETPASNSAPVVPVRTSFDLKLSPRELAIWIYLFGVALQLALLGRNIVRVRRALRACTPLDNAPLQPIAARLQIRRLPRLLQSPSGSPFLVGIARPTIVVPRTLDCAHREAVFAHELAHHKRRDLTWNALLWALQTALWFHPLSWFSRRYHALEVESACDELTLELTQIAPKSYGALLIGAESSQPSPLTAGVNDHFFALKTRLSRLGRAPMQPRRRARALFVAILLVSFAAVVPLRLTARAQNAIEAVIEGATKPVMGLVLDPHGAPLAGASISVEGLDVPGDIGPRGTVRSDNNGRFVVPANLVKHPAQLFATWGERALAHGALVQGGDDVTLKLEMSVLMSINGNVREKKTQRPLEGIDVSLYREVNGQKVLVSSTQSNAKGTFRFNAIRPFYPYRIRYKSDDYSRPDDWIQPDFMTRGSTLKQGSSMDATQSNLRGRLIKADGTPVAGWGVTVQDGIEPHAEVMTRADGKFFFRRLLAGSVIIRVRAPGERKAHRWRLMQTGKTDISSIRLSELSNDSDEARGMMSITGGATMWMGSKTDANAKPELLSGQMAPELRLWPEAGALSLAMLHGKVTLIRFGSYDSLPTVVGNLAQSYQSRGVRVINISNLPVIANKVEFIKGKDAIYTGLLSQEKTASKESQRAKWWKEALEVPVTLALDLPRSSDPNAKDFGGQTAALYQGAQYVVIGRDGRVIYAGDKFDRAIETVTTSIQ